MEIVAQPQEEVMEATGSKRKFGGRMRGALGKRRKVMILAGMFVLLVVTGYLNWMLNSNNTTEVQGGAGGGQQQHIFTMFRQTRQSERASQLAILESMTTNQSLSAQARQSAEQQKLELLAAISFETAAEGLIVAQGFADAVVSKNGGNINVLVRTPENLTAVQVTQIRLILNSVANANIDIDNIFVSPVE